MKEQNPERAVWLQPDDDESPVKGKYPGHCLLLRGNLLKSGSLLGAPLFLPES